MRSLNDYVMRMGCTHYWFESLHFFFFIKNLVIGKSNGLESYLYLRYTYFKVYL